MEDDYFESALNSLKKQQDKRRLLQILVVIRKGVDDTSRVSGRVKQLNESGCVKSLVGCLQQENAKIVDVTLSVIGNCCVDPNFARDSMKLNVLHSLNRVLEKQAEDSIQGRVFRIVGNLCDGISADMIIVKEPALIDKIVDFLKKASKYEAGETAAQQISQASVTMALRSIRKLLRKSTLNKLVTKHDILNAMGLILIKYTQLWETHKQYENILQDVLRFLHAYSQYNHQLLSDVGLKNTENGDSLACLGSLVILNPSRVIKIILNLGRLYILKSDLPIYAIWQNLLAELKNTSSDTLRKEYLKSLCELVDDPANREYLALGDNVKQLIDVLNDFTNCTDYAMECCSIILSTLNKCQYDDLLVTKQVNYGMIGVLTEKLEWICGGKSSRVIVVPSHSKRKRKRRKSPPRYKDKKFKASIGSPNDTFPLYLDSPLCREERCDSPSECSEISSNGPYSPSYAVVAEDVSDSDNYSPICSDAEDADEKTLTSMEPFDENCAASSEDDDLNMLPDLSQRMKSKLLDEINTLLIRYTRIRPVVMELANPKLLTLLMNISIDSCATHNVVKTIVCSQKYLIPLMLTDFVHMVYDVTSTEHGAKNCWSCHQISELANGVLIAFTSVAESGCGQGDIAHQLLRAKVETKGKLVLSIPYVIRSKQIISKLMLNCGGLDIFLKLLSASSDLQSKSIKGLCVLAMHHLKIKNPVTDKGRGTRGTFETKYCSVSDTCENIVIFKLDDGTSVEADRDFLSEKSDYFNRLLCGSFKESKQTEINLQNVTNKSFRCLLCLLHNNITKLGVVDINVDLETILDLLELTERYLMVDLNVYLTGCVEQLHITNKTAPTIYQWSIESGTNILRVEVVAFALVADILDSDRVVMFQSLFDLGYAEQLVDDIQKLLVRFLR